MKKYKILVVDDETPIREAIIDCLPTEYEAVQAMDGQEALDLLQNQDVDVIVTDFNMPIMNGREFIKSLHDQKVDVPIICITGRGSQELHADLWSRGTYEYLEKPFHPDLLLKTIHSAITSKAAVTTEKKYRNLAPNYEVELSISLRKSSFDKAQQISQMMGCSLSSFFDAILEEYKIP